jgi:hypothetical protein
MYILFGEQNVSWVASIETEDAVLYFFFAESIQRKNSENIVNHVLNWSF